MNVTGSKLVKDCILNLSKTEIPPLHKDLLNLGPQFVVNEKKIPYMDIIATTERVALQLETDNKHIDAEVLRTDVKRILIEAKPPRKNITRDQATALKEIVNDVNVDIYPFDKGSGFVRIDHDDALIKIEDQIGKTKILKKDPTPGLVTKVQSLMRKHKDKFNISQYRKLYPTDGIPPRIYGMVKAHKPEKNYPMRMVVSTVGTPVYEISEYLVNVIQNTLNKNPIRVLNSSSFINTAKTWAIHPNETQVSLDVVNLYPSVPIKKATENILKILSDDFLDVSGRTKLSILDIKEFIDLCLQKCYFLWNNTIRSLDNTGPIGLSLMVVMAEAHLQIIEGEAINIALHSIPPFNPISHMRYVDDTHTRFDERKKVSQFVDLLNSIDKDIQYTTTYEDEEKCLDFSDITILNNCTVNYEFKVFRKEAITNVQVNHIQVIIQKALNMVYLRVFLARASAVCSPKYLEQEFTFITSVFVENGYQQATLERIKESFTNKRNHNNIVDQNNRRDYKHTVSMPFVESISYKLRKSFKKTGYNISFHGRNNLRNIICAKNKPKLPKNSVPGVYRTNCGCNNRYVGQTGGLIKNRNVQHEKAAFKFDTKYSGLAEHATQCDTVEWNDVIRLSTEPKYFERCIRETLEIQCNRSEPGMPLALNRDRGQYVTTNSWKPFFTFWQNREPHLKRWR